MLRKLIELVRNEPCLYDTNHIDYNNKTLKGILWARIATDLKYKNGAVAKEAWQKLRNCHREAIRRRKKLSLCGTVCSKSWKFEKQMEFLVPHMTNSLSTSESLRQADIKSEEATDGYDNEFEDDKEFNDDNKFDNDNDDPLVDDSQFVPLPKPSVITKTVNNHENASMDDDDDLRHFFNTMYTITKKMPPLIQHKLKRKIFNIISDEEEYILQAKSKSDYNRSSDSFG